MSATDFSQAADDFGRIEKAIQFIEANFKARPGLEQIARSVHLSKYHFDRLFKRWAGISPVRFMQYLTLEYTKQKLINARSVLDTALDAGLSGPSRLHDLYVTFDAMTPGEFKKKGAGLKIEYGFQPTPFGKSLLALTRRGICYLGFVNEDHPEDTFNQLLETYPGADFSENSQYVSGVVKHIFRVASEKADVPFNLQIKGTNFQVQVWKALLNIPQGRFVSYQDIAAFIGRPKAVRAVANAVAVNPVSFLIPCHRVISKTGRIHRYRWGAARKKALIGWEAAQKAQRP